MRLRRRFAPHRRNRMSRIHAPRPAGSPIADLSSGDYSWIPPETSITAPFRYEASSLAKNA